MHILCTICSDLVNPAESLFVTKCGHLFHHQCLAQWIERSKSCPQCRNKVTERCMFRMYPTVSNESSSDDVATLQSRLDDAMLQLRTQRVGQKAMEDNLAAATELASKKEEMLKAAEKRLASRESAVAALRDQLEYVKVQNRETTRLREENDALKKNLKTLHGLQKVLNATAGEVEDTLKGYSDLRTLATFAAALKRALCDSEAKKRSCVAQLHGAEQRVVAARARHDDLRAQLGQVQENLTNMERKYEALKHKRKASGDVDARDAKQPRPASPAPSPSSAPSPSPSAAPSPSPSAAPSPSPAAARESAASTPRQCSSFNDAIVCEKDVSDVSFGTAVQRIVSSESPYLSLKHSGLALAALQQRRPLPSHLKPTELAILRNAATSIFHRSSALAPPSELDTAFSEAPYDGLGGHARPDTFPTPRPKLPKLSGKHKLKRFHSTGSRDISQMFADLRDRD